MCNLTNTHTHTYTHTHITRARGVSIVARTLLQTIFSLISPLRKIDPPLECITYKILKYITVAATCHFVGLLLHSSSQSYYMYQRGLKTERLWRISNSPQFWERLFAVHGLLERTAVQTSSLLLRFFFLHLGQPDPTRPISLTLTQTPTPADRVVPIHSWRPLGHITVWADFVGVSGSVLYLVRTQSKK